MSDVDIILEMINPDPLVVYLQPVRITVNTVETEMTVYLKRTYAIIEATFRQRYQW